MKTLAITSDDRFIISGSVDKSIKMWDIMLISENDNFKFFCVMN